MEESFILENSSNHFDRLIQTSPNLICRYNLKKEIEFMNQKITELTGQPPEVFVGRSIRDFPYPESFFVSFESAFDTCVATRESQEIFVYPEEGQISKIHFSIQFIPILYAEVAPNVVQGIFTISRDITEIKELEINQKKQIEDLNLLSERILVKTNKLQNFAYIVTHNLNSNLANLEMLMEMYETADSPEEKQEIFEQSKNVQKNLSQTLKELSEVVKINQNIEVEMEHINIQSIVDHVCGGISMLLAQTEAKIETDFVDQPVLEYNKVYLESIIQNLITNAIKYRHPDRKPHLKFTCKQTDTGITLSCTDNGRGIDLKKYGEKIFGLHRTFHGNQDARGVGLFITRNQVEALGGSISVESEVGIGTTFTIRFGKGVGK